MSDDLFAPGSVLPDVAIFPLPQVVLFPGALMPLHIFEPRYRAMTRDVLASTRILAVTQIPERCAMDHLGRPEIATVCGVGEIIRHDVLPDGRFNILVQGRARARVEELPFERPYRRARLTILGTTDGAPASGELRALSSTAAYFAARVRQNHPAFSFAIPEERSPGQIADLCAHYLVLDGEERQRLLEILDDAERVRRCLDALLLQQQDAPPDSVH